MCRVADEATLALYGLIELVHQVVERVHQRPDFRRHVCHRQRGQIELLTVPDGLRDCNDGPQRLAHSPPHEQPDEREQQRGKTQGNERFVLELIVDHAARIADLHVDPSSPVGDGEHPPCDSREDGIGCAIDKILSQGSAGSSWRADNKSILASPYLEGQMLDIRKGLIAEPKARALHLQLRAGRNRQ